MLNLVEAETNGTEYYGEVSLLQGLKNDGEVILVV